MVTAKLQKRDNDWIVTLPEQEIKRLGLGDGQEISVQIAPVDDDSQRRQRIDEIMDDVVVEYREAFEYLARN